ncbi:alpha/beta fold hydrolase [Actinosynnema sp. NPDC050436]|uniref:alpha/beta fold hydrolase n=1 Tax=Actinosynnema sp. NPDC050436 TaxID=3155659 RepID=UPI0033C7AE03
MAESCRRATGPLVDHVDTISAAKDFDVVRVALRADKVSWLGMSYGTLLGATYAQLFPSRVRSAVLDGAIDHTIGARRMATDEARSTEDVFHEFARWCSGTTSCALNGRDVTAEYQALLARADRHGVPAEGVPGGITAEQLGYGVYSALYLTESWPRLSEILRDVMVPDADASLFTRVGSDAAYRVIGCHDFPSDVRTFEDFSARQREARRLAPVTRGYIEAWDLQAGCAGRPIRAANPWSRLEVRGARNVLVVSGEHDPATPRVWGDGLVRQIRGAEHLVWSGVGHTGYFNDPATRDREVDHLLNAS